MVRFIKRCWRRLSLAQQFAVASFVVLVAGMVAIGWWVSKEIESGVTHNTAVDTALYMNSFVTPEVQDLAEGDTLPAESIEQLDQLFRNTPLGKRVRSVKVWAPGGRIVYSSRPAIIGRTFPLTPNMIKAWGGNVASELSDLEDEEDALERGYNEPLLEIYSPVREKWSERIIAVAEFYKSAVDLEEQLFKARAGSWVVVAFTTLAMFALLFGIVRGGSQTIRKQQDELQTRVKDLSRLLDQNEKLHARVRRATGRATELNERFLRRVSAELHDGPAQALGFALLRLDAVKSNVEPSLDDTRKASAIKDLDAIRGSLNEAMQDIRHLSAGLALPELDELSLTQSLQRVVRAHERRTGTKVELNLNGAPAALPLPLKIGTYRFVQEALNNAYNHGGGEQQCVDVRHNDGGVELEVSDGGRGFDQSSKERPADRLGLTGMRERIESLGGTFELNSKPGVGTRVTAYLPTRVPETADVG